MTGGPSAPDHPTDAAPKFPRVYPCFPGEAMFAINVFSATPRSEPTRGDRITVPADDPRAPWAATTSKADDSCVPGAATTRKAGRVRRPIDIVGPLSGYERRGWVEPAAAGAPR